jgi:ribonuclease Z
MQQVIASCFRRLVFLLLVACASAAFSQNFTVTLLGTGNPRATIHRFGPSILVQAGSQNPLFDCGRGATIRLAQLKVDRIDGVFLTHLHSDHTVGIPDLWLTRWVMGRKIPFRIWGPEGTRSMMDHLAEAYAFDIHMRRDVDEKRPTAGVEVQAEDIQPGVLFENDGVKVTAFLVDHGPVKPAFGYRVDFHGHSVVLSGDTRYSENLIKYAQGTDVLIHEVIDPEAYAALSNGYTPEEKARVLAHHTTPNRLGESSQKWRPNWRCTRTSFRPMCRTWWRTPENHIPGRWRLART